MIGDVYRTTEDWKHIKNEVNFEITAVLIPLFLYFMSLLGAQFLDTTEVQNHTTSLSSFWKIPDAFFGGCIIFSFAIIQLMQIGKEQLKMMPTENATRNSVQNAQKKVGFFKWLSVGGLVTCIILSSISVIHKPDWSFMVGMALLYFGCLVYKRAVFYRSYLRYLAITNLMECNS